MRTTTEIIGAVERGDWASTEELRGALMVAEAVARVACHNLRAIVDARDLESAKGYAAFAEGVLNGLILAMGRDPMTLGDDEVDPGLSGPERVRLAVGRLAGHDVEPDHAR